MARRASAVLALTLAACSPSPPAFAGVPGSVFQVAWLSPDVTVAVASGYYESPPALWWAWAGQSSARPFELPRASGVCDDPVIVALRRLAENVLVLALTCPHGERSLARFDVATGEMHRVCVAAQDPCPVPPVPWADPGAWPDRSPDGRTEYVPGFDGVYARTDEPAAKPVLVRGGLTATHHLTVFTRGGETLIAVCAKEGLYVLRAADGSVVRHWPGLFRAVAAAPGGDRLLVPDLRVLEL